MAAEKAALRVERVRCDAFCSSAARHECHYRWRGVRGAGSARGGRRRSDVRPLTRPRAHIAPSGAERRVCVRVRVRRTEAHAGAGALCAPAEPLVHEQRLERLARRSARAQRRELTDLLLLLLARRAVHRR